MNDEDEPKVFVIDRHCDQKGMRVTNFDKWVISCIIGVIFFIFCLPFTFRLSNSFTRVFKVRTLSEQGIPTLLGILLHAIIFIVVIRLLMH